MLTYARSYLPAFKVVIASYNNVARWKHKDHVTLANSPLHGMWCYFISFSWRHFYDKTKAWKYREGGKLNV